MDNLTADDQVAESSLPEVFADSEASDDAAVGNAAPEAFEAAGEYSEDGPEDEEDEDEEEDDSDDEGGEVEDDESEAASGDEEGDDLLAENETVPSSETDFSGETPL